VKKLNERVVVTVLAAAAFMSLVTSGFISSVFAKPYFLKEGFRATYRLDPGMVITEMVVNPDDPNDVGADGAIGKGGTYSWQVESLTGSYATVKANLDLDVLLLDLQTRAWWNKTAWISVNVDDREAAGLNGTSIGTINYWINPSVQKGDTVAIYGKPPYQISVKIMNYLYNPVKVPAGEFDCWVVGISTRLDVGPPSVQLLLWYDMATGILVAAQGDYFDVVTMLMGIEEVQIYEDNFLAPAKFVLESMSVSPVQHLLGDVNGDGKINIMDITLIARAFGSSNGDPRYKPECDLNGDGTINIVDLTIAATQFRQTG
jgi:hypothetical protein